jgi:hypothetical protein
MTMSMYAASAPLLLQTLKGLSVILTKAEKFAHERKLDEAVLLGLRTYPDMFPLSRQVEQTSIHAMRVMALLAGKTAPVSEGEDATLADLKARVDAAIDYVSAFDPEAIDGSENREVTLNTPRGAFNFTGEQFLINVTIPNVLFHAATAYNLLRGLGLDIGKMDFVGRTTV